jgi:hypothetical protein
MRYGIITATDRISLSDDTVFEFYTPLASAPFMDVSDTACLRPPAQAPDRPSSMR